LKKVGIMVLALALLVVGGAMAESGGIEATKLISFMGENGAQISSNDNIVLSGSSPAFCNTVEAGSSFTMEVVNARTETNSRFVVASLTSPLTLNHNIRIDKLSDLPSKGKVSAFMEGNIQEGRGSTSHPFENIEFKESTSMDGRIRLFDKVMGWESGSKRG